MARPGLITYYNWLRIKSPYKVHLMKCGYADLSAEFGRNLLAWTRLPGAMQFMIQGTHVKFFIISSDAVHAGTVGEIREVSSLPELRRLYYKFLEDNWRA